MELSRHLATARVEPPAGARVEIVGEDPILPTSFAAGEAAATALGLVGAAAARVHEQRTGTSQGVSVDVSGAALSLLSFVLQKASRLPDLRRAQNAVTTLYEGRDGRWIHLHGGFPHLAAGTLAHLGCADDADAIARAVRECDVFALEDELAEAGLCGAVVRSLEEWAEHPQGRALADLPVVEIEKIGDASPEPLAPGDRPLSGVRALDLTRVLAGPTCGRTLASFGADVLRIGAERLPSIEPFVIDTGQGKRNAFLDLDRAEDAATLGRLAEQADVFCQGYRPGGLERRGFGPHELAERRPGIVYVSIDCYGHHGPWAGRPGWEQLAQSAVGIAHTDAQEGTPTLIPAAATDYTTGYLAAFGVLTALARRQEEGGSWHVKASLCQTGMWLTRIGARLDRAAATGPDHPERFVTRSETVWGELEHVAPIVQMEKTPAKWERPPSPLGSDEPHWIPR